MRRPWPLLLLALVVGTGAPPFVHAGPPTVDSGRPGARVLPLPKAEDVFHFVIFGDRTGGPAAGIKVLQQAVRDTNLLDPDLVMTVGDLIQGYNAEYAWLPQMREFRGVMDGLRMPWYPVAGNHDIYWRGPPKAPPGHHEKAYEKHFGPLWYWFPHKNAAFVVLYSDEGDPATNQKGWHHPRVNRMSETQLAWLKDTLAKAKAYDHVFVFLHHPRWLGRIYRDTNWQQVHDLLKAPGNVKAVFAGHIHRQRYDGVRDGIEYFALATTGGAIPHDVPGSGCLHHLDVVTVRPRSFQVATVPIGAIVDPRTMTPEHLADIDTVRHVGPAHSPTQGAIAFRPDGTAEGEYRVTIPNRSKRPIHVTVEPIAGMRGLWFHPDHEHRTIASGTDGQFVFRYGRAQQAGSPHVGRIRLSVQLDYLGEHMRVRFPPREHALPLRLVGVPPEAFASGDDHVLSLHGDGGCLQVDAGLLDVPDGPFTLEGWIQACSYVGRRAFLAKTEYSEYAIFVSGGEPEFSVHLGGAYVAASPGRPILEPGRWTHLAGVFDGSEVRLYVDGRKVASTPARGRRTRSGHGLLIGADPDARGNPMSSIDGRIDEVRVSRGARYTGERFEPATRFEPDGDTLLLLHLDRALGAFVLDHAAGARHPVGRGHFVIEAR